MDRCPYCSAHIDIRDRVCPECNARKGYLFIGNWIQGPMLVALQGVVAPVLALLVIPVGFLFKPDPRLWAAAGGVGVAWLAFGIMRLREGPRWFRGQ